MSLSLAWPPCALMALACVLTFALLGCSLRRMRSRDRLTVTVWWFASVWTVGSGLWATWTLALAALTTPVAQQALQLRPSSLAALALAAATIVTSLHFVSRLDWPEVLRCAAHTTIFAAGWALTFEVARRSFTWGVATPGTWFGVPALALSVALVAFGCATALWLVFGERWRQSARVLPRLWLCAATLGACHGAALLISLTALRLPAPPADAEAAAMHAGVGAGSLLLVCALATMLVVIGLVSSWLDTHAHTRNRLLANSLNDANRRLRDQAHSDPLTRMPNRLMFEERMVAALADIGRKPEACALAVLFIDLDGFKPVNDSFGHVAGDAVLREIGRRLQAIARPEDTVARVGGDEFLLMTVRPGHEAVAAAIAQRVLQALNEPLTLPNAVTVNLSASIGIVMYPEHGPHAKMIANADAAMYAAKRAGGSTYAFFEPRMELDAREQLALQNDLRHAIERHELQLYYQPKIHAKSGQITGVEALLRWQHAVRGFVPPNLFIPVAERFGLIGTIGNWVIDEACRQMREWKQQGLRMRVSVNLSVHQLRQEDLVQRVRIAVDHFGVDPALLTFEITESVAMEDTQETMRAFSQLAAAGVSLSIDDFGTGYSSLSYLRKLPAKQLKIDQSFVQDLGTSQDALAVVDAVIKLAHALGLQVVAEGVETARQRDILLGLQCDELQGYLFARPMAARLLTLWAMGEARTVAHTAPDATSGRDDFRDSLYAPDGPDAVIDILQ
ncbi:MAG: bifunctional diguanylate cyclase/phosphodiesterase [Betaproteobacteria bacterium]